MAFVTASPACLLLSNATASLMEATRSQVFFKEETAMAPQRFTMMAVGLIVATLTTNGFAQEKTRDDDKERLGLIGRVLHLMPPAFATELKLTTEQQGQIQKLEQEFKEKRRASLMQTVTRVMVIIESMEADDDDKETAPVLALAHEITGGLLETRRSRIGFEKKMMALLNVEQQVKFGHLKDRKSRGMHELAAHTQGANTTLHFYSPQGQEKLQLTDEQRRKLGELQRDLEVRLRAFLTDDQRRVFDEMNQQRNAPPVLKSPPTKQKQDK
jgi:Spy/CpxP family protein refolding chaperone